ncbi:MAG: hypothetical protein QOD99_1038 [Chthoniobacter sp.]|nr:hypothetical protein [Chthoniobacter sp.]
MPKPVSTKPRSDVSPTPDATETPAPTAQKFRQSVAKPPVPPEPAGMNEPPPFVPTPTPAPHSMEPKTIGGGEQERARYQSAKAKALSDEGLKKLQEKADNAEGEAQQKATREYYQTLFNKMRKLEPTLKDRIDRTEAATMRRLDKAQ